MAYKLTEADSRLMAAYVEAALRIERQFLAASDPTARRVILARIEPILRELEEMTATYVMKELPVHFRRGSQEAVDTLRRMKAYRGRIDESFTQLHKEALQAIADEAARSFGKGIDTVRGDVERMISTATKQRVQAEILAAEAAGGKAAVREIFESDGITGFRSANRTWTLENYSAMITRTIAAEAHNTGSVTRYAENGVEYVRIIERETAPDVCCQWMKDKIVWIGERRLLNPYHPSCLGSFAPWFGDTKDAIRSIHDPRIPQEVKKFLVRKA